MHLNELKALHVSEVLKQAEALEIENTGRMRKQELMFAIIKKRAKAGELLFGTTKDHRAQAGRTVMDASLAAAGATGEVAR